MHKLTFFPIGNADCCLVDLANGQKLLFDYADCRDPDDDSDLRIDLAAALRDDLEASGYDGYNVVAFTHADDDHVRGASEFFYLEHALKYQDGERAKIRELWVPAAMIVETGLEGDARILQSEARYRLKEGRGIRVFSRPERLREWLQDNGLTLDDRRHLITDAGQTVPGFTVYSQGVEFFVHSPFAARLDGELVDRNDCALVLQATFDQGSQFLITSDVTHEVLTEMIRVTRYHDNDDRLKWDIFWIPHHCSYLSLSDEKGSYVTTPVPEVAWLLEEQGAQYGLLISTSKPIPDEDTDQPPHRPAANYYQGIADELEGEFVVTMQHPTVTRPEPLVITLDDAGATIKKGILGSAARAVSRQAPRAG